MAPQTLPPPISHQMAPHRITGYYDPATQYPADRSDRRPSASFSSYSSRAPYPSSSVYPNTGHPAERVQSPRSSTTMSCSTDSNHKPEEHLQQKSASGDSIQPHLQIPSSINTNGGSLAEFAAQITCLFWFESKETLKLAENSISSPTSIRPLVREAKPAVGFRKWVVTILSTTQVTQNVILLALLLIYRLKIINPTVKGKVGSEYRLLTVALMLGNKFLDDNTYTNKTWAEVSGISVGEIHVMEVEFLSNMRYSLLASKEEWKEWQVKLGNFWNYFDRASRAPTLPSPVSGYNPPMLPSPPVSMQSSPPHHASYPSASNSFSHSHPYPSHAATPASPLHSMPDLDLRPASRKRSYDDNADEPPTKRTIRQHSLATPAISSTMSNRQNLPRLPIPNLSIQTREPMHPVSGNFSAHNGPVLPPLSGHAMSSVYPSSSRAYSQQPPLLTPTASSQNVDSTYGTPSRHHSPRSMHDSRTNGSSPMSANFSRNSFSHHSPSIFLQQRSSPYKPVRHVNTLLYPPPQNSMQGGPTNVGQMHYQPLGKRNDYRSGVVPEYSSHQNLQQWHALPQPNFHA